MQAAAIIAMVFVIAMTVCAFRGERGESHGFQLSMIFTLLVFGALLLGVLAFVSDALFSN